VNAAAAILARLRGRGARLHVLAGRRLGVEPRSALTEDLRGAVQAHKNAIVQLIESEGECPAVGLERAWAAAVDRAKGGFTRCGTSPVDGVLTAAAKLELDLAEPEAVFPLGVTPEIMQDLLNAVYSGQLDAELLESGVVLIRCAATTPPPRGCG
jgi:hypothetical protein